MRAPGICLRRKGARRSSGAGDLEGPEVANKLEKQAADLKRRFNRDFWLADRGYFAVALDADGGKVDTLTSNNGHLLWSGIVDKSKAGSVAKHLMGQRLFSGGA